MALEDWPDLIAALEKDALSFERQAERWALEGFPGKAAYFRERALEYRARMERAERDYSAAKGYPDE